MNPTNRQWLLRERPAAMVGPEHFERRDAAVPQPGEGEVLVRTRYVSLDPANRAWMAPHPTYKAPVNPGDVMHGFGLGEVVASRAPGLSAGDWVDGMLGWQDYAVLPAREVQKRDPGHPPEQLLGALGITGLTAYFGLLDIGRVQAGETVLVSAAAGAVGSVVGQIARIKGCRAVGIAGGERKCAWLRETLGFDAAIDYKAPGLGGAIRKACPDGVDVYFDNVGGSIFEATLPRMNLRGRIVACGSLSNYNDEKPGPGPRGFPGVAVVKRLRLEGFIVLDYAERFAEARVELGGWLANGSLQAPVDLREGFERLPAALVGLFNGENFGKLAVRI